MSRTITRNNVKFVTSDQGFAELMNSTSVQELVGELAQRRAASLTDGEKEYRSEVVTGQKRCRAYVSADNYAARLSNLKNNDLLKALK